MARHFFAYSHTRTRTMQSQSKKCNYEALRSMLLLICWEIRNVQLPTHTHTYTNNKLCVFRAVYIISVCVCVWVGWVHQLNSCMCSQCYVRRIGDRNLSRNELMSFIQRVFHWVGVSVFAISFLFLLFFCFGESCGIFSPSFTAPHSWIKIKSPTMRPLWILFSFCTFAVLLITAVVLSYWFVCLWVFFIFIFTLANFIDRMLDSLCFTHWSISAYHFSIACRSERLANFCII